MSSLQPRELVPGDWEAYSADGSQVWSSLTHTWSDFSTLQEIAGARLHMSNEPLRQVNIWTGTDWMTLIPPYRSHPVFAYRWIRASLIDISNEQALPTYSYTGVGTYTSFGFVVENMGVLVKVFTTGGITTSAFSTSNPFPF